ncbi:hypothetical protein [Maribacter chungangensis]
MVLLVLGCKTTKKTEHKVLAGVASTAAESINDTILGKGNTFGFDDHEYITLNPSLKPPSLPNTKDSLEEPSMVTEVDDSIVEVRLEPKSPVAKKIVENYLNSDNKEPNGHCLAVSKDRFEQAYKQVHGHLPYKDLPKEMASRFYTPRQVFNLLYVSASEKHQRWRSLPKKFRGKGNAGAIAYAGMGTLVDSAEIWSGQLRPGALMQVWRFKEDYEQVVRGTDVKKLDPYGHSFIFIGYVRDENHIITGLRIADQGFQSYRPLIPRDYEVWWGVNLTI